VASEFRGPIGLEYGQRNLVRGPGAFFFDAGLGKTFPIVRERVNLKFRADAFNLFNHENFGPPAGGIIPTGAPALSLVNGISNFGQIVGTAASPGSIAIASDGARGAVLFAFGVLMLCRGLPRVSNSNHS
jgi:hypothetical protein